MSYSNLHRRIDKMLEAIHQQQPARPGYPLIRLHLFTEQEQDQLSELQGKIIETDGTLDYLRESELDELCLWRVLEHALNDEDVALAQECRAALAAHQQQRPSEQELKARFLSIDTSLFNTPISPGPGIYLDNFYRLQGMLERGEQLTGIDWHQLEWWIRYNENYPARIEQYAAHVALYGRAGH